MESGKKTVLVIGATGVIGGAHVRSLAGREDVDVVALSRRELGVQASNLRHLALDLILQVALSSNALEAVTHMVYAAFVDAPNWEAQQQPNCELFASALDLIERHCPALRHVTLLQGMKAYGSYLGPFKTPAKEEDPRIPQGHYYYDQQDALTQRSSACGWTWTALRPHVVLGPARNSPQNLIAVIGVYASLLKARGEPLTFPGAPTTFDVIYQATDAGLLSQSIEWAGIEPRAAGEVFNITNGDFFRWRHVWPKIADLFGMEAAGVEPRTLVDWMQEANSLWDELIARHDLEPNPLEDLVSWRFADYVFGTTWDVMASTFKCRRAGFLEFVDSEQVLLERLAELRTLKIVP